MPNPRRLSKQESDALMERMAAEFAAQFARIEQDLLQTMSDDFRRGYHGRVTSADRHMEIARLRQRTLVMLNDLQNQTPAMVQRMIDTASEQGALAGLSMLQGSGWIGGGAQLVQSPAVLAITTELINVAQNATRAILPSLDQFIRRAVAETVPDVLLGMTTQKKVQAKIWQKSLQQGITHITDASGRRWNLATYVEMASRTATRRAFTESSVHQMVQHGVELFTPVIGRDSCKSCAYWAGKILSRGTKGRVSVEHATRDGEMVTVEVKATIDEARAQGWQHPNCRCQLVAYIPGLSVVADSPGHDPVREGQRVKLRELERKVRAAKTEELAAITPEQKARAKAKVRDAQAAIRDHVEEADIPRRRDREQLNLGHKDKPPRTKPRPVPGPPEDPMPPKSVRLAAPEASPKTLAEAYAEGFTAERKLAGGRSGDAVILGTLKNGTKVVVKDLYEASEAHADYLAGQVFEAVGGTGVRTALVGEKRVVTDYLDGATGMEYAATTLDRVKDRPDFNPRKLDEYTKEVFTYKNAREIALLDDLISNMDRHNLNYIVKDGKVFPIDHGLTYWDADGGAPRGGGPQLADRGDFVRGVLKPDYSGSGRHLDYASNFSRAEIIAARQALMKLKPEFDKLGRSEWFDAVIKRINRILEENY